MFLKKLAAKAVAPGASAHAVPTPVASHRSRGRAPARDLGAPVVIGRRAGVVRAAEEANIAVSSSAAVAPSPGPTRKTRTSPSLWTWNSPGRARAAEETRVVRQADGAREVVPRVSRARRALANHGGVERGREAFDREGRNGGVAGDPVRRVRVTGGSGEEPSAVGAGRSRGGASEAPPRARRGGETRLRTAGLPRRARASRYPGTWARRWRRRERRRHTEQEGEGKGRRTRMARGTRRTRGTRGTRRTRGTRDRFGGRAGGGGAGGRGGRSRHASGRGRGSARVERGRRARVGGMNEHELAAALVIGMKTMPGAKISPATAAAEDLGFDCFDSYSGRTRCRWASRRTKRRAREMRRGYLPSCLARRGDAGSPRTFSRAARRSATASKVRRRLARNPRRRRRPRARSPPNPISQDLSSPARASIDLTDVRGWDAEDGGGWDDGDGHEDDGPINLISDDEDENIAPGGCGAPALESIRLAAIARAEAETKAKARRSGRWGRRRRRRRRRRARRARVRRRSVGCKTSRGLDPDARAATIAEVRLAATELAEARQELRRLEAALRPTVTRRRATGPREPTFANDGGFGFDVGTGAGFEAGGSGRRLDGTQRRDFRAMVVQRGSELRVAVVRERSEISRRGVERGSRARCALMIEGSRWGSPMSKASDDQRQTFICLLHRRDQLILHRGGKPCWRSHPVHREVVLTHTA